MAPIKQLIDSQVFYLEREEVLILHAKVMEIPVSTVLDNVRDDGLLESALARPKNACVYEEASLMRQAATLVWGMVKNHPFRDGNKRTGYLVLQAFLRGNGLHVKALDDEEYQLIVGIANGRLSLDDVEKWINQTLDPWPTLT